MGGIRFCIALFPALALGLMMDRCLGGLHSYMKGAYNDEIELQLLGRDEDRQTGMEHLFSRFLTVISGGSQMKG